LALDAHVTARQPGHFEAAERCIAIAASLANLALNAGLPVGLMTWSGEQWLNVAPNRGKRHRRDLLATLARLPVNTSRDSQSLLDQLSQHQKSGTTAVLITPRELRLSLGEHVRGTLVVLSPASAPVQRFFRFDPGIDFSRTMPAAAPPPR
jgi:uncharacterized protein (DUF58 family)